MVTLRGSRHGKRLLAALHEAGTPADLVVVITGTRARNWRLFRSMARRIGWVDATRYAVERFLRQGAERNSPESRRPYRLLAGQVVEIASARSAALPRILREREIDLLLLGQSGILPEPALAAPRIGTLNAHPGILPEYRGVDCPAWALLRREFDKVGCSAHWVDAGVDTGPILRRVPYRWRGDESLPLLEERLDAQCIEMLAELMGELREGRPVGQPNVGGTQYFTISRAGRRAAARNLAGYLAAGVQPPPAARHAPE